MAQMKLMIVILTVLATAMPAQAGKLESVREELKKPSPRHSYSYSGSSKSSHDDGDDFIDDLIFTVILIAAPFVIPYNSLEKGRWRSEPGFLDWPYQGGADGYGTDDLDDERYWDGFAGRLQLGAGLASWGYRFAGDLRLSLDNRVDLNFSGYALVEPLENKNLDIISFYEPGASWLFALGERAQFRVGVDLVLMVDRARDIVPGFTANYSIDWFPVDPLVITVELGAGYLDDKFYGRTDVSMGLALGPIEPFIGYEVRAIGQEYLGTASTGLRIWV